MLMEQSNITHMTNWELSYNNNNIAVERYVSRQGNKFFPHSHAHNQSTTHSQHAMHLIGQKT